MDSLTIDTASILPDILPISDQLTAGRRVSLVTLGCSKNLVDSEQMAGLMSEAGLILTADSKGAEIVVVNTCAFIESARVEAIDAILELAELKDSAIGNCKYLIVTGCLSERYAEDIRRELPEVDAILGTRSYYAIVEAIQELDRRSDTEALIYRSTRDADALKHLSGSRRHSTGAFAYLKIAEGCSRHCTYCAIPGIRGNLQSRAIEDIVSEALDLSQQGVRELILVAQDTTSYGMDIYNRPRLADLLTELAQIPEVRWIRILYMYADRFDDELIQVMKHESKILPYVDLPIQHASDRVLKRMGRPDTRSSLSQLLSSLRMELPDVSLRTTVMVGFPGETEEDYQELLAFIREFRFDHLGCFIFSPEEGTAAVHLDGNVDLEVAKKRYDGVMALQQEIAEEQASKRLGETYDVLLEELNDDGLSYRGRAWFQAPEADSVFSVYAEQPGIELNQWYSVKVMDCTAYEYTGITLAQSTEGALS